MLLSTKIYTHEATDSHWVYAPAYGITKAVKLFQSSGVIKEETCKLTSSHITIPKKIPSEGYIEVEDQSLKIEILLKTLKLLKQEKLTGVKWLKCWLKIESAPVKKVQENVITGSKVVYLDESDGGHMLYKPVDGCWQHNCFGDVVSSPMQENDFFTVHGEEAKRMYEKARLSLCSE